MTGGTPWLLALDTATNTIAVAAGRVSGELVAEAAVEGRHRHSQELLPAIVRLVDEAGLALRDLAGVVVGTGPGAFTGLRVGLATAKTLAHEAGVPIVGISSAEALLAGVDGATEVWLPSGPRDRVLALRGAEPRVVRDGEPAAAADEMGKALAVDLEGRAPEDALALGRAATERLAASLLRMGAARLALGESDDPERLVPRYAVAPRGAVPSQADGGVAWSRDPR